MNTGLYSGVQLTVNQNWFITSGLFIDSQTQGNSNAEDRKRWVEQV